MLNRYKITIISETIKGQFAEGFMMIIEKVPNPEEDSDELENEIISGGSLDEEQRVK